jgi:hypothetical protein
MRHSPAISALDEGVALRAKSGLVADVRAVKTASGRG